MNQGRILGFIGAMIAFVSLGAQAKDFPAKPGEYVVRLKSDAITAQGMRTESMQKMLGAQVKRVISNDLHMVLVQKPIIESAASVVSTLSSNPLVQYAEPNYIYKVNGGSSQLPNDPELLKLWGLANTGQKSVSEDGTFDATPGIDIDAVRAWQIETGSKNVVVAVIDTGVNYNEPDLKNNIFINQAEANGKAGVDDDNNGFIDDIHGWDFAMGDNDPMDVFGHGTHVSGTMGATANDGVGITGVAWNVSILPVRFLDDNGGGSLDNAVSSIEYATKMKVNIMSNSWGGGGFSQALLDAITEAKDAGILFVAAAGNEANNNDSNPSYPASYQVDNVISVAAIDPNGRVADFSNYGATSVHIAAPGVGILSHTMAGLESWDGTSMATPHVSGVAALLFAQDMTQSYATIKSRILNSARPLASLRGRVSTGGLVNAYYALTNQAAPSDPLDPYNWQTKSQTASTDHPYADKVTKEFTFTVPGAKHVAVSFANFQTEANYDKVTFKDGKGNVVRGSLSGKLGRVFGPAVEGDTVTVVFTSDSSNTAYGFDIDGIAFH